MNHEVPVIETSFRPLPGPKTDRIRQQDAINHEFVMRNLEPQLIHTRQNVGVVNVLSPYTSKGLHVMLLDITPAYAPTPTEISNQQGEEMMRLSSDIVDFQKRMPGTKTLSWGYNNSPWNYGEEEEKGGGLQSITTKHHLQIWNRPPDDLYAPLSAIPAPVRQFIEGDSLTRIAGRLIQNQLTVLNSSFVNLDDLEVNKTGLHVMVKGTLSEALKTSGFFSDFIKPLHSRIEQATIAFGRAVTDKDFMLVKRMMQQGYELGEGFSLPDAQKPPRLIPSAEERRKNIENLRSIDFPDYVIDKLKWINTSMKNRDEVPERKWVRNGLGYALVITQDVDESYATLHIRPAVLLERSRGGVVETQGIALRRIEKPEGNETIVEENTANVLSLKKWLAFADTPTLAA